MNYLKGKDIKVPFDCLWYYYTRKFEVYQRANGRENTFTGVVPEGFEKW